jgi:hypothetical protein
MDAVLVVILLAACGLIVYFLWASIAPDEYQDLRGPFSAQEEQQAHLDLHRIQRRLDLALAKHEQRWETERVKQGIAEALDDDAP